MAQTETEVVQGIGTDYERKYGFSNPTRRGLLLQVRPRAEPRDRRGDLAAQERAGLDAEVPPQVARLLPRAPAAAVGRERERDRLREHLLLHPPDREAGDSWEDLPADIKDTWDKLGIPEAEKKYLAGVGAQYESEVVYHKLQESLEQQGVIFLDMDSALRDHEELVKQYFGTIIPQNDNKFAALNSAVVGRVVHLRAARRQDRAAAPGLLPHQRGEHGPVRAHADPRRRGRVRPLRRGCTAPIYSSDSLHSAVVEIVVKKDARCRYTTIQNWSNNVYNLVTKRAVAYEGATMEWVDGNLGSKLTMKYPAIWLMGERAHGEVLDRVRRQGPAPGRGRQVRPRRAQDDVGDHVEVDLTRRRARGLPRPARGGARTAPSRRSSATR